MDGFECCRALRRHSAVPIIIVTARTDTHDVVAGLEAVPTTTSPSLRGKGARCAHPALLRRARPAEDEPTVLTFGTSKCSRRGLLRHIDGEEVHCTRTEFRLLCELAANPNKVLSREQLLDGSGLRLLRRRSSRRRHIRRLRTKWSPTGAPRHILTVRGMGYKLVLDDHAGRGRTPTPGETDPPVGRLGSGPG